MTVENLKPTAEALVEAYAEIARLKARLQLAQRWAATAADALQPSAEENMRLKAALREIADVEPGNVYGQEGAIARAALEGES